MNNQNKPPSLLPRYHVAKLFKMPPLMYTQLDYLSERKNQSHSEFLRAATQAAIEKEFDNYPELRLMKAKADPKANTVGRLNTFGGGK